MNEHTERQTENENTSPYIQDVDQMLEEESTKCRSCGSDMIEEGYSLALCSECRDNLSKRPIPLQIKITAIAFVLVIIVSLLKFPESIRIGIEYERGVRAEKSLKYVTAMRHFENAAKDFPDSDKIMVRLLSAYYENEKINEAYSTFDKLAGPSPETKKMDKDLVTQVNVLMDKMDRYYSPSKELYDKLKTMKNPTSEEIVNTIKPFVDKNTKEVYGAYALADSYFEMNKFDEANAVLTKILASYPDFYSGQLLKAATLRELGQYDKSVECANEVLKHNSEDIGAFVTLSKIELKRKNNEKGLEYARQAYNLDNSDPYIISNLSLAYHYNNMIKERDDNFKTFQNLNSKDKYTIDFLNSIYSGSLQWQK